MPGPHDVDDLDFSDLDLDSTSDFDDGFDGTIDDEPAAGAKPRKVKAEKGDKKGPDLFTLVVYGAIGLGIVGAVVWQLGLFNPPAPTPFTADGAPQQALDANGQPIPSDATAQPGTSDPFNVMGTPTTDANGVPIDPNAPQTPDQQAALTEAMNDTTTPAPVPQDQFPPATVPSPDAPVTSVMPAGEANAPAASAIPGAAPTADGSVPMPAPVPVTETPGAAPVSDVPAPAVSEEPAPALNPASFSQTPAPAPAVSSADLSAVMARLDAIEKRLNEQQSAPPAVAGEIQDLKAAVERLQTGPATKSADATVSDEAPKKVTPKKKKAPAKKKTAAKKKTSTGEWDAPYNSGSTATATNSSYTLRAAQPGAAWVSGSDGALQEVRVGDSLSGIGEVRSISQSGGRWTVVGTQGKIAQ